MQATLQELIDKINETPVPSTSLIIYGVAIIVALFVLALIIPAVLEWILRPKKTGIVQEPDLDIDIHTLPSFPISKSGRVLEFYNKPVRLVLIVLAPAGTGSVAPSADRWNEAFESIVPGLSKIVHSHRSTIRTWPVQLSMAGFATQFFNHVPLPGKRGKGTKYSAIAGTFDMGDRSMLAGMVFETEDSDHHGQYPINHASEWLGILRVKEG